MKASSRWWIAGLGCLALVSALAAYKYFQIQAAIAQGQAMPESSESVESVTVQRQRFNEFATAIGEIVAPQALELRNEIEGTITALNVVSGERVEKGEVLVQLDVSEENARLEAARARVKLAQLDLERAKRLIRQKGVSEETVDQAEADYAVARADVAALEATIAKKTLRAPFDAVAGIHSLEVGEYLEGNTAIVPLVGVNDYTWVDFHLPRSKARVSVGDSVRVQLAREATDAGVSARVIARDVMASASSRNVQFRARIDQAVDVPPRSVVNVSVPQGSSEQIALPRTAVQVDAMGDYVYVLEDNPDGDGYRARRRAVTVGYKGEEQVGVIAGLEPGERVAARGAFKLQPGMLTFVRERPEMAGQTAE